VVAWRCGNLPHLVDDGKQGIVGAPGDVRAPHHAHQDHAVPALDVPLTTLHRMYLGSARINEIQWDGPESAAVRRVNDTSHLP
jgi:hypothetical protein